MKKDFTSNDILHINNNGVEYIQFRILNKYKDKLTHAFALRNGGVSEGIYSSLNFRILGRDKKENIIKNLEILCSRLNIDSKKIYKAKQDHTDKILIVDSKNKDKYKFEDINMENYDGYITYEKDVATLITTADCNPIIIYDPVKNIVANVHSGWKGTVKQIYLNAVSIMNEKFGSKYEDMIVCIGPSINKCCWVSSDEKLKEMFIKIWPYENEYIETKSDGEFHVDFPYVIKKDLVSKGVKDENIVLSDICTSCNTDICFSYRKMKKMGYDDYATMATVVTLI